MKHIPWTISILLMLPATGAAAPAPADRLRVAVIGQPAEVRDRVQKALLGQPSVEVVDLRNRKKLLAELAFDRTGLTDPDRRKELRRLLAADAFMEVYRKGDYTSVQLTDGESGRVEASYVDERGTTVRDFGLMRETLGKMLRGLNARRSLAALKGAGGSIEVKIEVAEKLHQGQEFTCTVTSGRDGFLTLFDIQPDGTFVVLSEKRPIKANVPFRFPPKDSMDIFEIGGVLGDDTLYAIVTEKPFLFPRTHIRVEGPVSSVKDGEQQEFARGIVRRARLLPLGERGVAVKVFRTVPK